jgi:exodeoxyribonuclease VII large subunit
MVADLRASTPTAAAEAVAPSGDEVAARLASLQRLVARGLLHAARDAERRVAVIAHHAVFRDPKALTAVPAQRLDAAAAGLPRAIPERLRRDGEAVRLLERGLSAGGGRALERATEAAARCAARLADLSPLGILARGYAVCYGPDGRSVVRSAAALSPGDRVSVRLHEGSAGCLVESVRVEGITDV